MRPIETVDKSKMSTQFSSKGKRFSIDDAFEEETDEAIKVYGSTNPRSNNGITKNHFGNGDHINVNIDNGRYVSQFRSFPELIPFFSELINWQTMLQETAILSFKIIMNVPVKRT